jgi:hypothetical protein
LSRPSMLVVLLVPFLLIFVCGEIIGLVGVQGFSLVDPPRSFYSKGIGFDFGKRKSQCHRRCFCCSTELNLQLGEYSVDLERPLGMILEERGKGGDSGVMVQEVMKDGSAWKNGRVAPCEVLLAIDGTDVSKSSFDSVMEILTSPSENKPTTSLLLGDGLGQFDMPKNVVQRLKTTEDAFFVDAVVREAVRTIRRDGRLGDLLSVEVVIGAGVTTEKGDDSLQRGMVRFFGIFSTDGVTTYSCNVSATGIRKSGKSGDENDPNKDIQMVALSCAKDEGLGRTYDLIQED